MSNEIHETQSPGQNGGGLISPELKKMLVPFLLMLAVSFGGSWFAAQRSQDEVSFKTDANKEAIAQNAANIKQLADAQNQIVIQMARFSEAQTRIAEDLKQLQQDQRNNNFQMNRQR